MWVRIVNVILILERWGFSKVGIYLLLIVFLVDGVFIRLVSFVFIGDKFKVWFSVLDWDLFLYRFKMELCNFFKLDLDFML